MAERSYKSRHSHPKSRPNITAERRRLKMSQAMFARECGWSEKKQQLIENGEAQILSDDLILLASKFGVTTDWLLGISSERLGLDQILQNALLVRDAT